MSRPTGPVPPTFVTLAERGRRRETPTERQIRGDAPAAVAADMLAAIWRHPDRFPGFSRATRIERAFRQRHPALEGATVAGLVITPLSLDGAVPAGASEAYVWASQIGGAGLLLWTATTVVGSLLAVGLIEAAQSKWRAVNAPHLVKLVRDGATFEKGKLVEPDPNSDSEEAA